LFRLNIGTMLLTLKFLLIAGAVLGAQNITECEEGVQDCSYIDTSSVQSCAEHNDEYPSPDTQGAMMALASIFALFMAFGIGANDAANSWGTSVGSGAVSVRTGVLLCGVFEFFGATCLGSGVSSTIQKGVSEVDDPTCWACGYCDAQTSVYMGGMLGALIGASVFLLIASLTAIPVSTTHAIVGGVVGMTVAGVGTECLNWAIDGGLGGIVLSWVISPILSGLIAVVCYAISMKYIIQTKNPLFRALVLMPILYFLCTFLLIFVTTLKAKAIKNEISLHTKLIISLVFALVVGLFANFVIKPEVKRTLPSCNEATKLYYENYGNKKLETDLEMMGNNVKNPHTVDLRGDEESTDEPSVKKLETELETNDKGCRSSCNEKAVVTMDLLPYPLEAANSVDELDAIWVFRYLLVFNACLESFAHGSNDTANATGAFSAVYQMYTAGDDCQKSDSEVWIMAVAGIFVALGVGTLGYRVIRTIGSQLTLIDFHKGFYIELGSTTATIIATMEKVPVSTTHCQVGAVFAVGLYSKLTDNGAVNAGLLMMILLGWVITIPLAGGISMVVVAVSRSVLGSQ